MTRSRVVLAFASVVFLSLVGAGGQRAFAFVPSCTEEVAANYPPMLRADLSACKVAADPKPEPNIDAKAFASNLAGTWVLQSRTIQGITIENKGRIHIEFDSVNQSGAVGAAVSLECVDAKCERTRVLGAWTITLMQEADRVALSTKGQTLEPNAKVARAPSEDSTLSKFFHQSGVYVAIHEAAGKLAEQRKWDRVVMTDKTLTYLSCRNGQVDRYVKVSKASLVDGTPVRDVMKRNLLGRLLDR
jgi:hypothetical protein